ncbi:MAG: hypothetical protein KGJ80_20125, partial [Chloroflexota bacterium]|nr:hypothetical protein [Chloroflexota bacterium]
MKSIRKAWHFNSSGRARTSLLAFVIALFAIAVMQIPYALGYSLAQPGTEYSGLLLNVEDYSYYAIMLQGYDGAWQYHIQFTSEEHAPAFLYGFYLALGHLARGLSLSIVVIWHCARIITALTLFLVVFGFIGLFLRDPSQRWFAYLLAVFGSGFDWTFFPFEQFEIVGGAPVDFRMPEAHLFFTALTYPHVSMGVALLLTSFWLWLRAFLRQQWRFAALAGLVNLAIGMVYPFMIYLVAAVLGAYWLYAALRARKFLGREFGYLVLAGLLAAPLYAYYEYVLITNAVFRAWDAQAVTLSPNPLHYLLAYGVMLVLAALVFSRNWQAGLLSAGSSTSAKHGHDFVLLWIWVIIAALLLYAPLNAQRRFLQGLQVPLAILATLGLFAVVLPRIEQTAVFRTIAERPGYTTRGLRRLLMAFLLVAMSTANIIVLLRLSAFTAVEQTDALFRPRAEIQAVDWLRDHTARSDVVLGAYWTGSFIPARAGNAVLVGQRYETMQFEDKLAEVD